MPHANQPRALLEPGKSPESYRMARPFEAGQDREQGPPVWGWTFAPLPRLVEVESLDHWMDLNA